MESKIVGVDNYVKKPNSRLECMICNKTFLYKIAINKHMEKHEQEEPKVEISDSLTENLTHNYKRVYTGIKPFNVNYVTKILEHWPI